MQERFYKVVGKVLKLWERLYCREKVGKVSKFQERLFNDDFKAGNGEERKGKGKLSVPPLFLVSQHKTGLTLPLMTSQFGNFTTSWHTVSHTKIYLS